MIVSDCIQGSNEWFQERLGHPTASKFGVIITPNGKPTTGVTREKYLYKLVTERITGECEDEYISEAMVHGTETESEARSTYSFITDSDVGQVGLVYKDDRKLYSCSPDGFVYHKGTIDRGLEIKCPLLSTHISYIDKDELPPIYKPQVQGSLFITGLDRWDFMSYFNGMDPLIVPVEPDLEWHKQLENVLEKFCEEIDTIERKVRNHVIQLYP